MSPWCLCTAAAARWIDAPGSRRTSPNAGPESGPEGERPLNVESTLTAPDTVLPEIDTPCAPWSATVSVGSEPAAPAAAGIMRAPRPARTQAAPVSHLNRLNIEL